MKKSILTLTLVLLLLLSACGGTPSGDELSTGEPGGPTAAPADAETLGAVTENRVDITMDFADRKMTVVAEYTRDGAAGPLFLLNRDFKITQILCDGEAVTVEKELFVGRTDHDEEFAYEIGLYRLPPFERDVRVEYIGILDGTTGTAPYIRETISPEFTLLRVETFYHPLFLESEQGDMFQHSFTPAHLRMTVHVPKDYTAAFPYVKSQEEATAKGTSFTASFDGLYSEIAVSVAKYQKVETELADFYFLRNSRMDPAIAQELASNPRAKAFFNDSAAGKNGNIDALEAVNVIEIPEDYGASFLCYTDKYYFDWQFVDILRLVEAEPEPIPFPAFEGESCSILFVSNSEEFLELVPLRLQALAEKHGVGLHCDRFKLDYSYSPDVPLEDDLADVLEAMRTKPYDFAVYEGPIQGEDAFWTDAKAFCGLVKENGIMPVLYTSSWVDEGSKYGSSLNRALTSIYEIAAMRNGAVMVNAADARLYTLRTLGDDLFLSGNDGVFDDEIAYHTACVFAATLFDLPIQDPGEAYTGGNAAALAQMVWEYVSFYKEHQRYPD